MKNWINIISLTYPQEAYMVKSILEAEDIKVFLKDEYSVLMTGFFSNAIGGIKLFIHESDKEKALEILTHSQYINKKPIVKKETFSKEYKEKCPYCNSENITKSKQAGYIFILFYLLLELPLPFIKKSYYCFDCDKEWNV